MDDADLTLFNSWGEFSVVESDLSLTHCIDVGSHDRIVGVVDIAAKIATVNL